MKEQPVPKNNPNTKIPKKAYWIFALWGLVAISAIILILVGKAVS